MAKELTLQLSRALDQFVTALARFLPRVLAALILLILGWLLAALLRTITRRVLGWVRFDQLVERLAGNEFVKHSRIGPPHVILGTIVYWLTWAAVLLASLSALNISGTEALVADFVHFVPSFALGALVLVAGFAISTLVWRVALLAAVNARLHSAKLLAALVRALVLVASAAMAFGQLGVDSGVLHTAFAITFGAVMLGLAIAFGLGGRHAARRFLEDRLLARGKQDDETSHI